MADTLVIAGPTASGKTAVAVEVARRLSGEVISMDSRQVYRGMDVGTAKPALAERGGVPHHGFDLIDPDQRFNAGRFADLAHGWMREIRQRGCVPVIAGGTGFFLRALTDPMFDEPDTDPALKESWKRYLATLPTADLLRWAGTLEPAATSRPQDRQRLARTIEVAMLTGRTLGWWQRNEPATGAGIDPLVFVLDLPRDILHRRIEARVEAMIDAGLVEEVRGLLASGYDESATGMSATGYREILAHIRGECSIDEAVTLIQAATRQYARRQITWLRHQLPHGSIWLDAREAVDDLAGHIVHAWTQENS
jgi:tRNA dimethylallyltransferase